MIIDSPAFVHEQSIPSKYTCMGDDVSPPLRFHDIPKGTKSLALIVEDPDAPAGTFDHWITWNIPPDTKSLPENVQAFNQGLNGFHDISYRGPCPPPGAPHHYYFKLYALDTVLTLPDRSLKKQLEEAMEGHILAKAVMIGTFGR